ncbi:heme lyase NrfEFG subunit NrfF [Vibrio tubiashii]|uniref:Formate-dependent nitrite reductase complex subunit n=1 Tax=Vibrio tubiashii ATCC 19109 TaxID=1051646 RepID=F9T4L0_9VIBR|nr:heme lyase NrfEFG subunit NrfF [Vibrio tubiashii]AIW13436.1 heme transporter CcmA [Vibrio tubiashii ATCC 19109]EGU55750.1 cytochrome C biogenesis protein [Vibrio tubiashii ATCC 19109]EIF01584.1 cytochrome C biogenesis protein [Vibrio tubiashii NCIMB 1337 = ATCC 19106]
MNLRLAVVQSLLLLLSMLTPLSLASANQDVFAAATTEQNVQVELFQFDSPHKQKVAIELAKSLRCPQCQNQNLVESNSPIAKDLRLIVFSKINQGQSEQQVIDFMTARYGEFVLYKPTFTASNALLWLAPILLLLLFLIVSFVRIEQRKQR